jgi:hypothetical protein
VLLLFSLDGQFRVAADVDEEGQMKDALLFRLMDSGEACWWQGSEARRTPQNPASPLVGKLHNSFLFETCLFEHSSHPNIYNLLAAMIKWKFLCL